MEHEPCDTEADTHTDTYTYTLTHDASVPQKHVTKKHDSVVPNVVSTQYHT